MGLSAFLLAATAVGQEAKSDNGRIGDFSIAPKIGWAYYSAGTGFSGGRGYGHAGMNLKVNLDFGGAGGVFELAPYYTYHAPQSVSTPFGTVTGDAMHSTGVYLGYAYRFHFPSFLDGRLYPSVGFGTKLGFWKATGLDWGVEVAPTVPLAVSYYFTDDIAVCLEVSFGSALLMGDGGGGFSGTAGFYTDGGVGIRWP